MGFYDDRVLPHVINLVMNNKQTRSIRRRVCADLKGEVLEIGFGTGHNLPYLPRDVIRVLAVDVIGLDGQRLPVDDTSVDAVLCTWSLCTIPDPVAALREVRRVLRPGGAFHFVEHGRAPDERVRRWQDRLNGFQQRVAGGCNLNRDIPGLIDAGGLTVTRLDTYYGKGEPKPYAAMYEGVAEPG